MPTQASKTQQGAQLSTPEKPKKVKKTQRMSWAELLARTFGIDTQHCSRCGGDLKIVAAILKASAIRSILGLHGNFGQTSR